MKKTQGLILCGMLATKAFAQGEAALPTEPKDKVEALVPEGEKFILYTKVKGNARTLKRVEVKLGSELFYSDPEGRLELTLPQRDGLIEVARSGYETQLIDFKELRGKGSFTVYLLPGKPDDSEVTIIGSRRPEVSKKTVSKRETDRIAPGADPAQIAQIMPGVQSNPGSTEVVIRGSGPNDSRYYVDDIEVPSIFHNIANLSVLPAQSLDSVDFNSGGFGVQYGEASGGVIVLRSKPEQPTEANTEIVANVPFYLGLFHERPLSEKSSMSVSVRRSTLEAILPTVLKQASKDGFEATVIPYFYDAFARYEWKNDSVRYRVTALTSLDGLTLAVPSDQADNVRGQFNVEFRNGFSVAAVEAEGKAGGDWTYRTTPQFQVSRIKADFGDNDLYLNVRTFSVPTEFSKRLEKGRYAYIGFKPEWTEVRAEIDSILPNDSDPYYDPEDAPKVKLGRDYHINNLAAWAAYDQGLGDLVLTPGLRVFKTGIDLDPSFDPRLLARYKLSESDSIKAAVGRYSIAPEAVESSPGTGNPDLSYEKATHYVLGVESNWGDRWTTDFQAFYKFTHNLVVPGGPLNYQGTGERKTYGFEAFVRRNLTEKFFAWLAYTYSVSEERKSDQADWYRSQYDQTHILHLVGSYRISSLWDLGTRFKLNSGNPYTPVTGANYNAGLDKYQPTYDTNNPNSSREAFFNSLDLFASYDSLYDSYKLKYQFGVQYLAIAKRVSATSYNYDYTKKKSLADLPPIPYLQVTASF